MRKNSAARTILPAGKIFREKVIDANSENTVSTIIRGIVRHSETTRTIDPELEVNVLGTGEKLHMGATSHTTHYDTEDFEVLFVEECEKEDQGVFVSIDEVQKIKREDMALICGAFQMASRKGYDVMLALAGLPYSYDTIIHYEGCTYMRRSVHEELGLFTPQEAKEAFTSAFSRIKGLSLSNDALELLVEKSLGHPYVIQLLGYYLVAHVNGKTTSRRYEATAEDVLASAPLALAAYERRALAPVVDVLSEGEVEYLRTTANTADKAHVASVSRIAQALGKTTQQLSQVRAKLLKEGLIISIGRGELMFNVPYLRTYITKDHSAQENAALVQQWRL